MSHASFLVRVLLAACWAAAILAAPVRAARQQDEQDQAKISEAAEGGQGVLIHRVLSPYQSGETEIQILRPNLAEGESPRRVVYLLPVEPGTQHRWGDAMAEVKRGNLHNQAAALFVHPTFSHLPWYCDHPTDSAIRQESHFLRIVLPYVEQKYLASPDRPRRWLVGFSKSGWGAISLLLRHPDRFDKAAAWDAPLMMEQPNRFGMGPIFGSQENFERYRISGLARRPASGLRTGNRLLLFGYGNFRDHHQRAHALLEEQGVSHIYRDGPSRPHHWSSGWLPEVIGELRKGEPAALNE